MTISSTGVTMARNSIPLHVRDMVDELMQLQVLIEGLPGPRMHQDHDFIGEKEDLEQLYSWLGDTLWVPYWGEPRRGEQMLLLGGRDPWIQTLELRLWNVLDNLARAANCELTGRGSVSPENEELEEIRAVLPSVAADNGWVFSSWDDCFRH